MKVGRREMESRSEVRSEEVELRPGPPPRADEEEEESLLG